ncbi:DNA polymerase III subunits gamma and tau [hydrothermal vent metagenome]|uniref:DNA-directed DNA polymerase n=1 Tax=hydrothermal vent metagenome TaxID=652676 RepID=A0A3B1AK36_9ZZZZ
MSYQVLARKWRPRTFEQLVGQEHVLRALIHALDEDRLHHAFLFTGTRGVGKTTIARILAKSLNCEQGVSSHPCGECSACREIDEGRFVDLIEVDAASRTKVDETRDLLDNVQYAPTRGRYKVYLIDEVHMFSNHSFNALLKTLEEPPPHVKFLLATTDPQKLPVTILSRCLQFNLRRLAPEWIQDYLAKVLGQEAIEAEAPALKQLARAADGSMRDALSLLDQAIAFGGGKVGDADVRAMLGTIDSQHVTRILQALAQQDAPAVMAEVKLLAEQAPDFIGVLAELITTLQHVALLQQIPEAWDESMGEQNLLQTLAENLSPEDVQLFYQIALLGRRDLPLSPEPKAGLEMLLLRMLAFRPAGDPALKISTPSGSSQQPAIATAVSSPASRPVVESKPVAEPRREINAAPASLPDERAASTPVANLDVSDWHQIVEGLKLNGILQQLAAHCAMSHQDADSICLCLDNIGAPMLNPEREKQLQEMLNNYLGRPVTLRIEVKASDVENPAQRQQRLQDERQRQAENVIENDENVRSLIDAFGASVNPDSIQPD